MPELPVGGGTTDHAGRGALLLACVLAVIMGLVVHRSATTLLLTDRAAPPNRGSAPTLLIDPNTAPWWELTVMPAVGEVTAKRIVDFREAQRQARGGTGESPEDALPVFGRAEDLQQVNGIGPKTVRRMEPLLTFQPEPFGHR
ncbi:MAG: ComEA family DNA-binding protein [Planctomycetota bacterium]